MTRLFMALLLFTTTTYGKELTKDILLEGLTIPEKREFPISKTVSPCEDFHNYVCSETENSFKLPADRSIWYFSFSDNSEKILHAKKTFFKKIEEGFEPEGKRIKQVKNYYLACMNIDASKKAETTYVELKTKELMKLSTNNQFQELTGKSIDEGQFSAVAFDDIPNLTNPEYNDLLIMPNLNTFPEKTFYENPTAVEDLRKLCEKFFNTLGYNDAHSRAKSVVEFEVNLAKLLPSSNELRKLITEDTYQSKEKLIKLYPHLKLSRFLNKLPLHTKIRNITPAALDFLNQHLVTADVQTLQNIYLFHTLKDIMDDSYPDYHSVLFDFESKYLRGPKERPPRNERCTQFASSSFSFEIDEYLIPILFPHFPQNKVVSLVSEVRSSLLNEIKQNKWLSNQAKSEAFKKMKVAKLYLVKPLKESEWKFNPIMDYSSNEPINNYFKLQKALVTQKLIELKTKRNRARWDYSPLVLNAYYSPSDNHFVLLQGILQSPFFDTKQSEIENYGAMGSIIGHELGHGIDDNGAKFDSRGALRQWMTKNDLQEFSKRGEKFVKQFDAIGHNGKLTLGENIGDHVGITSSYRAAFFKNPKASTQDKQSFFKAYARVWCGVARPEVEQNLLKTDPHSLGRERINQQVKHLSGFYEAFGCKAGDKMYLAPEERVKVW